MTVELKKGQKTDITKVNPGLETIIVGLGWSTQGYSGIYDIDLDAAAFILGENGKTKSDADFIFYNNQDWNNGTVIHSGDKKTGSGIGDDEQIKINLKKLPSEVSKVAFTCTIHNAEERKQSFGNVKNAYIRILNGATEEEIFRFNMNENFSVETAVIFGEIYRHNGEWKFNPVAGGYQGGLSALCKDYGVSVDNETSSTGKNINMGQNRNSEKLMDDMSKRADISSGINNIENNNTNTKVKLSKIELKKKGDKINLTKSGTSQIGKVVLNLKWNRGQKKTGLLGNIFSDKGIDLDLGCLYELKNGQKFVVQALGNCYGDYNNAPYIFLLNDDRTGDSTEGEFMWINGDRFSEIKRIIVFAFIYEGISNWAQADGVITVKQPNGPEIVIRLDEPRNGLSMCGAVMFENVGNEFRIEKIEQYFAGHEELDKKFGWGLNWREGKK